MAPRVPIYGSFRYRAFWEGLRPDGAYGMAGPAERVTRCLLLMLKGFAKRAAEKKLGGTPSAQISAQFPGFGLE